ncbi:zinc ribbon domain-containing protein [Asanoa sp. WMMD1127]|uniref:zinc ribbon domain-containing protein n=1 Tax=Asanoa sp. WMMD1127 TaxID=3016107 RepID=UPI0024167B88|nr:zinc ribbon domain-containing protein [Asanoa sp. WMMD1127]MDG4823280.1 zinc ribbon domain-containing protein [Asanoa sp. WMMD1127]
MLTCGLCQRRMNAGVHHGHIYYRCVAADLTDPPADHPPTVYLRQDALTARVNAFLRRTGRPVDAAVDRTAANEANSPDGETELAAARQAEAYARCGLPLTYHWDRDTVVFQVLVPQAVSGEADGPAMKQAEFVVG